MPFLYRGVTFAVFQHEGDVPVEKERLISLAILGAIAETAKHRRRAEILSILATLSGLIVSIILLTSTLVMAGTEILQITSGGNIL